MTRRLWLITPTLVLALLVSATTVAAQFRQDVRYGDFEATVYDDDDSGIFDDDEFGSGEDDGYDYGLETDAWGYEPGYGFNDDDETEPLNVDYDFDYHDDDYTYGNYYTDDEWFDAWPGF